MKKEVELLDAQIEALERCRENKIGLKEAFELQWRNRGWFQNPDLKAKDHAFRWFQAGFKLDRIVLKKDEDANHS